MSDLKRLVTFATCNFKKLIGFIKTVSYLKSKNMKNFYLISLALVAVMAGLTACSHDADEELYRESEIRLTSEITPTRVTSLDYQSTQIVAGQQVGVTITGAKAEHNNVA